MGVSGILNLRKPAGPTSFDVVRQVRRLTGERRVGHGGTLDPAATGVLPVFLGQATRVVEFFSEAHKTYEAQAVLGAATDTYDAEGRVTETRPVPPFARSDLERALEPFRGVIEQAPPPYSAVKHQGRRLYELARAGQAPPVRPRQAAVYSITLRDWRPPVLELEVECGKGTYVRSLVHDLGVRLGCLAHLRSLVRVQNGPFALAEALTLDQLRDAVDRGCWTCLLYPADHILTHLAAAIVDEAEENALRHGQPVPFLPAASFPPSRPGGLLACRAYSQDGRLVALVRADLAQGKLLAHKVLSLG